MRTHAGLVTLKAPRRWTSMTASTISGVMLWNVLSRKMPALLMTMSTRPKWSTAVCTMASPPSTVATLWVSATASPPASVISFTTDAAGPSSCPSPWRLPPTSLTTTRAPRDASRRAWARPRPPPAPVITATLPSKPISAGISRRYPPARPSGQPGLATSASGPPRRHRRRGRYLRCHGRERRRTGSPGRPRRRRHRDARFPRQPQRPLRSAGGRARRPSAGLVRRSRRAGRAPHRHRSGVLRRCRPQGGRGPHHHDFPAILAAVMSSPKPVVAEINGHVRAGGVGLVAACDIAVAPVSATFAFTEVRLGLLPAMIAVPVSRKMARRPMERYFLTGETFSGVEAASSGLVTVAVADGEVASVTGAILDGLRLGGPQALAGIKPMLAETGARGRGATS